MKVLGLLPVEYMLFSQSLKKEKKWNQCILASNQKAPLVNMEYETALCERANSFGVQQQRGLERLFRDVDPRFKKAVISCQGAEKTEMQHMTINPTEKQGRKQYAENEKGKESSCQTRNNATDVAAGIGMENVC